MSLLLSRKFGSNAVNYNFTLGQSGECASISKSQMPPVASVMPQIFHGYLGQFYFAVKRHSDHGNSYIRNHLTGAQSFRSKVRHHHGRKLGSIQAEAVLEKKLRDVS